MIAINIMHRDGINNLEK